jgi:uncharacterized protein
MRAWNVISTFSVWEAWIPVENRSKNNPYTERRETVTLQEKIKNDLAGAIKAKDEEKKSAIRVILGEFSRGGKKELPDDEVTSILKKLVKSEREVLQQKGDAASASPFIEIIETYLPQLASEAEITAWVREHVDFSLFKNKMQAMKPVMAHFGSRADGNTVKKILQEI